jgi:hypothetical protein
LVAVFFGESSTFLVSFFSSFFASCFSTFLSSLLSFSLISAFLVSLSFKSTFVRADFGLFGVPALNRERERVTLTSNSQNISVLKVL